ncbi:MAG: LPS export ABC transporter periplasmic protein LptC [Chitinophagaceae bacterium]|nr:MAG: LPS export ABC transporter periplasmic protein LptC [Chitinophagaceae bacterium]
MPFLTRLLRGSILFAALITGCFFISGCENDLKKVDSLLQKKTGVEEAKEIESYLSEAGRVKARLLSPLMRRYMVDSSFMEFPNSLHVDFYDDSIKIESTLDAKYAKYMETQKKIFLRDSVMVINLQTGDTLKSRELWWDQNKEEFYTDKPAELRQRNGNILYHRNGLRAAQDLSWRETYGNSGRVNASEEGLQ